jgi:membrane protein DedA with SNARE-associated domain
MFVWGIIFGVLGMFIGFLFWCTSDTGTYVLVWSIIACVVLVIGLWFLYAGGKDRRRQ